ncbi:hypothetical protein IQ266_10365 [filamentous cyanobacterium LEGE 11480]|uniref:Uncharacterized protein n=1 Tax=Romeriopsis navalis LEGE 11480 TaxID=2777977 RepID=A0A928VM26_9CYAN|nr:hypothetical protein [Romeriopsis navalis]MBE9030132.1 hypothetical protein [Romeriopsis navalis LEGE 11480]
MRFLLAIFLGLSLLLGNCITAAPATAAVQHCRIVKGKRVCIDRIKRSAKQYWVYKATLTVNGVKQAPAVYDCVSRVIVEPDDTIIHFGKNDPSAVVCDLFRERSKSMRLSDLSAPRS